MLKIKVKFITIKTYDFNDENGIRIKGATAYVYDPNSDKILKVKLTQSMPKLSFGDDVEINIEFNGNYVRYYY